MACELKSKIHVKEFHIGVWEEIIGKFGGISENDYFTFLKIGNKLLSFKKDSIETKYFQEKIKNNVLGKKIAVLKTDLPDKPFLVRIIGK